MDEKSDVYGKLLLEAYRGRKHFGIMERDDGFFEVFDIAGINFSEFREWPKHEKEAISHANGLVLDIGCGAGRHSLYLKKKGLDVTSIDISPLAVNVCKKRGLRKARVMDVSEISNLFDIFKPRYFDTVLMLGNNFGLFGTPERAKILLKVLYKITSPNAVILAESMDPYKSRRHQDIKYMESNFNKGMMGGQMRMRIRFEDWATPWLNHLSVSRDEMKRILARTGWNTGKFIKSGDSRYIAVIEKEMGCMKVE